MAIKSIDTCYKGYKFRSRLEARWAVFFDSLGIKWEYEKEGFEFEGGIRYLPDFWLPEVEAWAEVKAEEFNEEDRRKAYLLVKGTGFKLFKLIGVPEKKRIYSIELDDCFKTGIGDLDDGIMEGYAYILSNYHNYPRTEGRFYAEPSDNEIEEGFKDTEEASNQAKSIRFEFNGGKDGDTNRS